MKSLTPYLLVLSALVFIGAGCKSTEVKKTEVPTPQPEQIVQEEEPVNEQPKNSDENTDEQKNEETTVQGEVKTEVKTTPPITKPEPTPPETKPTVSVKEFNMV